MNAALRTNPVDTLPSSPAPRVAEHRLPIHGVLGFDAKPGATIACVDGSLWVTGPGIGDELLSRGASVAVRKPGRIVVEALKPSLVRIVEWPAG